METATEDIGILIKLVRSDVVCSVGNVRVLLAERNDVN